MEKIIGITKARVNIKTLVDKVSEENETYNCYPSIFLKSSSYMILTPRL